MVTKINLDTRPRLKSYILLLIVSIIWGVAAPVIKYTLRSIDPWVFLTYRFALSTLLALPLLAQARFHLPAPPREKLQIIIYGFLTTTVSLGLLFVGIDNTSSLTAAILSSVSPLVVGFTGVILLGEHLTKRELFGMGIAIAGTTLSALTPILNHTSQPSDSLLGNSLVLLSLLTGAATAYLAKRILRHDNISPTNLSHLSFVIGLITTLPITLATHTPQSIFHEFASAPLSAHLGVLYMAFLSGTLAYALYHRGQKTIEIGESAIFSYLTPLFASPLSILWLGERHSIYFYLGSIAIVIGVLIAEIKPKR